MTSAWEVAAVALAIAYLVLAIRESVWCWLAAFISTAIYLFLMYDASLYMESALQLFYMAIAVYGWHQWRRRGGASTGISSAELHISSWSPQQHGVAIASILFLAAGSGWLLTRYTDAALPYADAFTTAGAMLATWMVARKILENWLYWFVIDSVSIYLYLSRELYLTAALFAFYLVLIVIGYRAWRGRMLAAA